MDDLKTTKIAQAKSVGTAYGKGLLNDWQAHPEWFPDGAEPIPRVAQRIAHLCLYADWVFPDEIGNPSDEYKELCGAAAR